MTQPLPLSDADIVAMRPPRPSFDPWRPHAFFVEPERTAAGMVEDVATIFLVNRECPFRCVMCDLWKQTTETSVPPGSIAGQIEFALARLTSASHVKLYNSGNFFDAKAIPKEDHPAIARLMQGFETLIVENHPRLCTDACLRFRDRIRGQFEIAMGLETVDPRVLPRLNKQMTVDDFADAARFLTRNGISVRAFVLLKPPFSEEAEALEWCVRSIAFAFSVGVQCCSVIPTRAGNGAMDLLQAQGHFSPPSLESLERVQERGIELANSGNGQPSKRRVFADLWDIEKLSQCLRCLPARIERLRRMNFEQTVLPPVACDCRAIS